MDSPPTLLHPATAGGADLSGLKERQQTAKPQMERASSGETAGKLEQRAQQNENEAQQHEQRASQSRRNSSDTEAEQETPSASSEDDTPASAKREPRPGKGNSVLVHSSALGKPVMEIVHSDADVHEPGLNLNALRESLPKEVFVKSLRRSLQWAVWDMAIVFLLLAGAKRLYYLEEPSLLLTLRPLLLPLLVLTAGFFQWGVFVVGHDCGHGSFSEYKEVNFFCGLILHGSILVPFTPWARSHRFHHQFHNHVEKDYSHPWSHHPDYDAWHVALLHGPETSSYLKTFNAAVYPIVGYLWYLLWPQEYGGVDGSHWMPGVWRGDRLWAKCDKEELLRSWVSVAACCAWGKLFWLDWFFEGSCAAFAGLFLPSWFLFCFFLFTVTYLQHHTPTVKVYDDTTWRYATAAFETVDRRYGYWIDLLHHHISDCHVVHHLFFTKIPHYNLRKATDAMVAWLEKEGLGHLYKEVDTADFMFRVFRYGYEFGSRAKLVSCERGFLALLKAEEEREERAEVAAALAGGKGDAGDAEKKQQ